VLPSPSTWCCPAGRMCILFLCKLTYDKTGSTTLEYLQRDFSLSRRTKSFALVHREGFDHRCCPRSLHLAHVKSARSVGSGRCNHSDLPGEDHWTLSCEDHQGRWSFKADQQLTAVFRLRDYRVSAVIALGRRGPQFGRKCAIEENSGEHTRQTTRVRVVFS